MDKWETAPQRAWKDTNTWLFNHIIAWILSFVLPGVGTVLATFFIPPNVTIGMAGLYGFLGGVAGLVLFVAITYLVHVFITPYRQRNEARAKVERYEQERSNTDSKYYEQNAEKALVKHWEDLTTLCQAIADRMSPPSSIDERYYSLELDAEYDGIKTLMDLGNFVIFDLHTSPSYVESEPRADWSLYSHLHTHLIAEDPQ
jgi:membrane protein implicated in regulation of membrane protease activity